MKHTFTIEADKGEVTEAMMVNLKGRFEDKVGPENVALDMNSFTLIANVEIEEGSPPQNLLLELDTEGVAKHSSTEIVLFEERDPSD